MKLTKGMVNAVKAHAILVICVLNLIHVSTKEQERKTLVNRTRRKKCGIRVDCFYFEVLHPHCGNGTTFLDGSDYTVQFTARDCKGHVLKKLSVSWFELFSKNKIIQSISCSNKKQCGLSGESLASVKGDLRFGIWIKVPGSNKLIRLPIYLRLKEKKMSGEKLKAVNGKGNKKTSKTKMTSGNAHIKKSKKKIKSRRQNETENRNDSVTFVDTAFYGSIQRIYKKPPNTTNPKTKSKPPVITSKLDQSSKSNGSRQQEKNRKVKLHHQVPTNITWKEIELESVNKHNKHRQMKELPKIHKNYSISLQVSTKGRPNYSSFNISVGPAYNNTREGDRIKTATGNKQITSTPQGNDRFLETSENGLAAKETITKSRITSTPQNTKDRFKNTNKNDLAAKKVITKSQIISTPLDKIDRFIETSVNGLAAKVVTKNQKYMKNVARCLNFLCQSPYTQQCVKYHVRQCIHYESGAKTERALEVIRNDVLHLLGMFNITSRDLRKIESFARKAAVAISNKNTSGLPSEFGLVAGELLKKLYNASYLASKTALQEELGKKLVKVEKVQPTEVTKKKKGETTTVSCLERCNQTGKYLKWTSWEPWSSCTSSCGKSVSIRLKTCEKGKFKPPNHLLHCDGYVTVQVKKCKYHPCKIDQGGLPVIGMWSMWSSWSACSVTCGLGQESKSRTCELKPEKFSSAEKALYNARTSERKMMPSCAGSTTRSRLCITSSCNLDSEPEVRKVVEGSDTELQCGLDQGPLTTIYWITPKGQRISPSSKNPRFHINEDTLVVKEAQRYDSGVYHCVLVQQGQHQSTTDTRIEVLTCLSYPCQNGGSCEVTHKTRGRRMVVCHCPHGFHGNLCQSRKRSLQYTYILVAFLSTVFAFLIIFFIAAGIACYRNRRAEHNRNNILENKDVAPDKPLLQVSSQEKEDLNSSIVSSDGSCVEITEKAFKDFQGQNLYRLYKENIRGKSVSLPVLPNKFSKAKMNKIDPHSEKSMSRKTGQKSNRITKTEKRSAVEAVNTPLSPDIPTQSRHVQPDSKKGNLPSVTTKRSVSFQKSQQKISNQNTKEQENSRNSREGQNQTYTNAVENSDYLQIQPDRHSSGSQDYENVDRLVIITSDDMIGIDGDKALSESIDSEELDFTHRRTFVPHTNPMKVQNVAAKARVTPNVSSKIEIEDIKRNVHIHEYENGIEYIHKKTYNPNKRNLSPSLYHAHQRSPADNIGSGDSYGSTSESNGRHKILTERKQSSVYDMPSPKESQRSSLSKTSNHTVGKSSTKQLPFDAVQKSSGSSHASSLGTLPSEKSSKIHSADVDMDNMNRSNTSNKIYEPGYFMTSKAHLPEWDNYLRRESVHGKLHQENDMLQNLDSHAIKPQSSLDTFRFGHHYLDQESEMKSFNTRMSDDSSNSENVSLNEHEHFEDNYSSESQENDRLLDKVDDTDSSIEDEAETTMQWGMSSDGSEHTMTAVSILSENVHHEDDNLKSVDLPPENKTLISPFETEMNQLIDTTWDSVQEEYNTPPQLQEDRSYEMLQNRSPSSSTSVSKEPSTCSSGSSSSSSREKNAFAIDTDYQNEMKTVDYQNMGLYSADVDDFGDDFEVDDKVVNDDQNATVLTTNASQVDSPSSPRSRMCLNHYQMVYGAVGYHSSDTSSERPCCEGEEGESNND